MYISVQWVCRTSYTTELYNELKHSISAMYTSCRHGVVHASKASRHATKIYAFDFVVRSRYHHTMINGGSDVSQLLHSSVIHARTAVAAIQASSSLLEMHHTTNTWSRNRSCGVHGCRSYYMKYPVVLRAESNFALSSSSCMPAFMYLSSHLDPRNHVVDEKKKR